MQDYGQHGSADTGFVIWITGAPFSGKTSVASALAGAVENEWKRSVIQLDGDLLRLILGESIAESDVDRRTLGQLYVRLAKSLGRQGHIVVVSVVAMYREVFDELLAKPTCGFRAFRLNAKLQERKTRSESHVAAVNKVLEVSTDEVPEWVEVVENGDDTDPMRVAAGILEDLATSSGLARAELAGHTHQLDLRTEIVEFGRAAVVRERHWERAYAQDSGITEPSSFALWLLSRLEGVPFQLCLDFGCGNGRDAAYLTNLAPTLGVDAAGTAIDLAYRVWPKLVQEGTLSFVKGTDEDLGYLIEEYGADLFYSRFVWHALTPTQEFQVLSTLRNTFKRGSVLALEARTTKDPMAARGSKVSNNERVYGHYRRFVNVHELLINLEKTGFQISEFEEGRGLAPLGDDDPDVVRVIAVKS